MKKGVGAQLASAEGGELKGMYSVARNYVKRFHSDKSRREENRKGDHE